MSFVFVNVNKPKLNIMYMSIAFKMLMNYCCINVHELLLYKCKWTTMYCCINVNERLTYCRCLYYGKCKLTKVYTFKNWMTTRLRSCDMNAIGDAANHGKFASVTNRIHIAWTQTGRQSILIFTFSLTIYVKCNFLT